MNYLKLFLTRHPFFCGLLILALSLIVGLEIHFAIDALTEELPVQTPGIGPFGGDLLPVTMVTVADRPDAVDLISIETVG